MLKLLSDVLLKPYLTAKIKVLTYKTQLAYAERLLAWAEVEKDVLASLSRGDSPLVAEATRIYFRDVNDHAVQIIELLESYRDMLAGMLDLYLTSISNRQNEVMKVLTVIATVFIPLTFLVGVYGMNFSVNQTSPWAMPELHWDYGYPALWLVMLAVAGTMLVYFKRRRWF